MNLSLPLFLLAGVALGVAMLGSLAVASASEIKGAGVLQHPCGKVAIRHMGLVHQGKVEEAVKQGPYPMGSSAARHRA